MKKLLMALLCVMLCVCLVAPAFADSETVVSASATKTELAAGDTFSVIVNLEEAPLVLSGYIEVSVDSSVVTLQNGSAWSIYDEDDEDAPYPDINTFKKNDQNGAFAFAGEDYPEGVDVTGELFKLKLKIKDGAPVGETKITIGLQLKNASNGYAFETTIDVVVNVACPHTNTEQHAEVPAKCDETGFTAGTYCLGCQTYISGHEVIPAAGHKNADAVIENDIKPDCTNTGSYDTVVYCSVCKAELSRIPTTVDALGHDFDDGVVTAPDCENGGYTTYTCKREGCEYSEKRDETAALGHKFEGAVTTEPTCEDEGVTTYTCANGCGESYTEDIAALGHTEGEMVFEHVVNATCGEDGSHDEVIYCTVCKAELKREHKIDVATGEHVYATETEKVEPTCTVDGYVIMACGCGAEEKTTIPATGHTYDDGVVTVKPTCTEVGETTYSCQDCDHSYTEEIAALGHTAGAAVIENEVAPTCTTTGSYETAIYCSVCEAELSRIPTTTDALGHKPADSVIENEIAATCEVGGSYETVTYCSVCDAELKRETTNVAPLGHEFGEWVIVEEPSPESDGWKEHTCATCGKVEGEAVKHTHILEMYLMAPTCTDWGCEYYYCVVAGCEYAETKYLAATGHKYELTETNAASCVEKGYALYTCSGCGDSYKTEEAMGAHEITDFNEGFAASCMEEGIVAYWYCGTCNTYYADAELTTKLADQTGLNLVIPATGHNITSSSEGFAASCLEEGIVEYYYCGECCTYFADAELTTKMEDQTGANLTIPATGHNITDSNEGFAASCLEEGLMAYWYCGECCTYFADAELTTKMEDQTGLNLVIPVTGHNITSFSAGFAASCTEEGMMAYWYCGDCCTYFADENLTTKMEDQTGASVVLPTTEHNYGENGLCADCGVQNPEQGETPTEPTEPAPTEPEGTTAPTEPAPTEPGQDDPSNTGDATVLFVIFAMMILAGASVLVLKKKYL